jgi:hypothetical protein
MAHCFIGERENIPENILVYLLRKPKKSAQKKHH